MKTKVLMMMALLCTVVQGAWAYEETYENSYVECSWDANTQSVVKTVKHFNLHATYSTSSPDSWIKLENSEGVQHWVFDGDLQYKCIDGHKPHPQPLSHWRGERILVHARW